MAGEVQLDRDLLPAALAEVADVIGFEPTLRLIEAFGGWRVYVPASPGADCELAQAVGVDTARRLAELCPMQYLAVPACTAALRARRNDEIRRRAARGEKPAELAREFGLTVRQTYKILAAALVSGDN